MLVQILVGEVAVHITFSDDVAVEVVMKDSRNAICGFSPTGELFFPPY